MLLAILKVKMLCRPWQFLPSLVLVLQISTSILVVTEGALIIEVKTLKSRKDQVPRGLSPSYQRCHERAREKRGDRDSTEQNHPSSLNHQRQAGAHILKHSKQNTDVHQEDKVVAQSSRSSLENTSERVKPMEQEKTMPEPSSNGFHDAVERPSSTENSSSQSTTLDENSEMSQVSMASTNRLLPTQTTDPDKKAKEFKLNPGAKTFSPSLAKRLTSTHAEIGISPFLSHPSSPSKFVPYTNLDAGNAGGGSHFPQHMAGPTINRGQPHRFTTQYHSVQATPMLVNPNPQVMVGRLGQLMYMQPISQDLVQGAPHHPHLSSRLLFSLHQLQYPKHQNRTFFSV